MSACSCARRGEVCVYRNGAYLYSSANECQVSGQVGPGDKANRPLRGVVAIIPAGSRLAVVDEDIGKEFMCYEVLFSGAHGFVMAQRDRVEPPNASTCTR